MEAYNDMFLENSILQKENNNYRMKLKAMQVTNGNAESQFASTSLFSKLPGQETAKRLFGAESSCHLPTSLRTRWNFTLSLIMLNIKQEAVNINFYSLWFDQTGNRTLVYRFSSRRSIHSTTDRYKR